MGIREWKGGRVEGGMRKWGNKEGSGEEGRKVGAEER